MMAEYIERTEELIRAVNAGARAIENTKRYHGSTYVMDVFSDNPREIPYLKAAEILRRFDEIPAAEVAPVQQWIPVTEPPKKYRDEYGELIPFLVCEEGTEHPFRAMYDGKTWGDGFFVVPVKYWMPLPDPPEEVE